MQVMPEVGERTHRVLYGDRPYNAEDLYQPAYNAALGTAELGLLNRSLDGTLVESSIPAVIAAYNGGEDAVRRWLAPFPAPRDPDEFGEDVSFAETREYVRRVLGYVMAWRWVYGDR